MKTVFLISVSIEGNPIDYEFQHLNDVVDFLEKDNIIELLEDIYREYDLFGGNEFYFTIYRINIPYNEPIWKAQSFLGQDDLNSYENSYIAEKYFYFDPDENILKSEWTDYNTFL